MSSGHQVDFVRKGLIVTLLLAFIVVSHQYVIPQGEHDPRGLFALGFVILAAYLIGELVELIKLPHITGYLLGGLFLGPSLGETLPKLFPSISLIPPFDHGVLNFEIIQQLGLLDTLALPLICLTAGGALKPREIWKAKFPISGLLVGQIVAMFIGIIGLVYLMSGPVSILVLPQLTGLSLPAILAIGAVIASISIATSDAATIAIVVSAKARGPMTTNIISVAVLKDVVVVIAFSATTAIATSALGVSSGETLQASLIAIALSCLGGVVLGGGIHLYLKLVGQELVLFLVGLIFTVSFISDKLNLESALMFIVAGFVIANWSEHGDRLIKEVERLSTPVFVVFFTLAGAKLHLDVLASIAVLAVALTVVRAGALYIGCLTGAAISGADEASRKYGWMGFVSQAGLAITLANTFPETYGSELGGAMFSFVLGGVALHELIGPAMLHAALGFAKELPKSEEEGAEVESEQIISEPVEQFSWGEQRLTSSEPLNQQAQILTEGLSAWSQKILNTVEHRHLMLVEQNEARPENCFLLSQKTMLSLWDSDSALKSIDTLIDGLSDGVLADVEPQTYEHQASDGLWRKSLKSIARLRYGLLKPKRLVDVRALGRYYFSGQGPKLWVSLAEDMLAYERDAADAYLAMAIGKLSTEEYQSQLLGAKSRIEQRLFRIIQRLYAEFSDDLKMVSTVALPAVYRRFRLVFDQRNDGLFALTVEKKTLVELEKNRWHAAGLRITTQQILNQSQHYIKVKNNTLSDMLSQISSEIADIKESLMLQTDDSWREWCLSQKQDVLKVRMRCADLGSLANWFSMVNTLKPHQLRLPHALSLTNDSSSILWEQAHRATQWESYPSGIVEDFAIRRIEERTQSLIGDFDTHFEELSEFLSELESILQFYCLRPKEEGAEAISRFGLRLGEAFLTVQENYNDSILKIEPLVSDVIVEMEKRWFTPSEFKLEEKSRVLSVDRGFSAVGTFLSKLKSIFVLKAQIAVDAPEQYRRLFHISQTESLKTLKRDSIYDDFKSNMKSQSSSVLLGERVECHPILVRLFRNTTTHTFLKQPQSPIPLEESIQWVEAASNGVLIISDAEWVLYSRDNPSQHISKFLESCQKNNCTLILSLTKMVWAELCRSTGVSYSIQTAIELPQLTPKAMEKSLLSRHLMSGYALKYPMRKNVFFRFLEEIKMRKPIEQEWMDELYQLSEGNILEAIRCWLNSIAQISDSDASLLLCRRPSRPTINYSDEELILIRQILRFGWVTADGVSADFLCDLNDAKSWLHSLEQKGILKNYSGCFRLEQQLVFSAHKELLHRGWS
jgi:Kef-type K+ transport system membrane component KefB